MLLLLLMVIVFHRTSSGQVSQNWVARYNFSGGNADYAYAIAVDGESNIIVTGGSTGNGTGLDIATVKYSMSGTVLWIARYNGPANGEDIGKTVAHDANNNIYVGGYSDGNGKDYITIKYNSSGIQQWTQRYNGPGNGDDEINSMAVDYSGNVYVTGQSTGSGSGFDYATIKYNSSGIQQWVQRYNGPGNALDDATSLKIDNSGNIYITGRSYGNGTDYDFATIKYSSDGTQLWISRFNSIHNSFDIGIALALSPNGSVLVTGNSNVDTIVHCNYSTVKYNNNGVQQWVMDYNGPGNYYDIPVGIITDTNNNVYMTGYSYGGILYSYDYATIKYSNSGTQQWVQRYNGPGDSADQPSDIALDRFGDVYVTGTSWIQSRGDYATIKYSSTGIQVWVITYNGPGNNNDFAHAIALDTMGNVYVTGTSYDNTTGYDYATIKYTQVIGIQPITSEIPAEFSLSDSYPNPFNPSSRFKIEISKLTQAKVIIYNILGIEIETLFDEKLKPGTYELIFDGSNFSSGVYFYQLSADDFIKTKKMVLIK